MKKLSAFVLVMFLMSSAVAYAEPNGSPASSPNLQGPPVERLPVDFGIVGGYRYLRVAGEDVPVYSAATPLSTLLYRFQGGYDFVTPRNYQGDWVEINPGEWVHSENLVEVYASQFTGVRILSEPAIPFGWILQAHYASNAPGGAEIAEAGFYVDRYSLVEFFETVVVDGWRWYNIGNGRWVHQTKVSKVQRVGNPGIGGRWVAIDLYEQSLVAYEGDTMVFATVVSSGLPGNDTNAGVFPVWARAANAPMSGRELGYGDYRLENVPYATYFDGDISLHGTYWHNRFGYRQSRGCVNLTISDAKWVFDFLGDNGNVYVYYSQSY